MMDIAIEKGLNATKVKVGNGEKTPGYAIGTSKLKTFLCVVFGLGTVLAIVAVGYLRLFLNEKDRNELLQSMNKKYGNNQANAIKLGVALQAALNDDDSEDHLRSYRRILAVVRRELDTVIGQVPGDEALQLVQRAKFAIEAYIKEEIEELSEASKVSNEEKQTKLREVSKMQEQALHNIISQVSTVKIKALDDMLQEIFAALKETKKDIYLPMESVERLEAIEDKLYDGEMSLEKGKAAFTSLPGSSDLPKGLLETVRLATTADKLGDIADEVVESAKINKGREALEKIKEKFMSQKKDWQRMPKTESSSAIRSDFTVKAVLEVQKLVSSGVIPMEFLDFGDLELQYQAEDYDEDDEDIAT